MEMQKAVGGKRMKNKKWKRMVGILVSIALLCSGLVGCSGKGNGGSSDSVGNSAGGTEGSGGDSARNSSARDCVRLRHYPGLRAVSKARHGTVSMRC